MICKKRLSDVPVQLAPFQEYLDGMGCDFCDLVTMAEFVEPQIRIGLLDELLDDRDEADEITSRMVLPYPLIRICGNAISPEFFNETHGKLGRLIIPDPIYKTSRVLSNPKSSAVAVLYERNQRFKYLEIELSQDFF